MADSSQINIRLGTNFGIVLLNMQENQGRKNGKFEALRGILGGSSSPEQLR